MIPSVPAGEACPTVQSVSAGRLFVYGTLMPGQPRWPALLPYAASWRPATAPGRMWDTGHGYPAVRFGPGGSAVPGVVVDLLSDRLAEAVAAMDHVEDVGILYRRVDVVTSSGPAMAYEWIGATDGMVLLDGGWVAGAE